MLQTVLQNFWTMVGIMACVAVIAFLVGLIITVITTTIDICQQKRIKDKLLRELYQKLNSTIQELDKQTVDKNKEK